MFKDKIVLVTGGGSGIGRCLCLDLATRGAIVVVADRNESTAAETAAQITAAGGSAKSARLDVVDFGEVKRLVAETVHLHGRLDYIFNNAGTGIIGEMRDLEIHQWRHVIDVNLWGVINGTVAAYEVMVRQGFGHIVNIASGFGLTPGPTCVPYATSKFGVVGLSQSLRPEAIGLGVRVSVACPGYVKTPILEACTAVRVSNADMLRRIRFRLCTPEECSRKIIRGVERDKALIVFPFYLRVLVWLHRFLPFLLDRMFRRMMRGFREMRQNDDSALSGTLSMQSTQGSAKQNCSESIC